MKAACSTAIAIIVGTATSTSNFTQAKQDKTMKNVMNYIFSQYFTL
jgi:hypothetical protein